MQALTHVQEKRGFAARTHSFSRGVACAEFARMALFVFRTLAFCSRYCVLVGFALKSRHTGAAVVANTCVGQFGRARVDTLALVKKCTGFAFRTGVTVCLAVGARETFAWHMTLARCASDRVFSTFYALKGFFTAAAIIANP